MAHTLRKFYAYESGTTDLILLTDGNAVTSPAPFDSRQAYTLLIPNRSSTNRFARHQAFTAGTDWQTFGMVYGFVSGTWNGPILQFVTGTGFTLDFELHNEDGDLVVYNWNGVEIGRYAAGFVQDTEYVIHVKTKKSSSTDFVVYLNGIRVINLTGVDVDGAATGSSYWQPYCDASAITAISAQLDCSYEASDSGASIDTNLDSITDYPNFYVRGRRDSASPVVDKFGTNPTSGSWANAQEVAFNDANRADWLMSSVFDLSSGVTCSEGSQSGPNSDLSMLTGETWKMGVTHARVSASSAFSSFTVYLSHGQVTAASSPHSDNTTDTLVVSSLSGTTVRKYSSYYTTFNGGAAYDADKWHQHGIRAVNNNESSTTFRLHDIYSMEFWVTAPRPFHVYDDVIKPIKLSKLDLVNVHQGDSIEEFELVEDDLVEEDLVLIKTTFRQIFETGWDLDSLDESDLSDDGSMTDDNIYRRDPVKNIPSLVDLSLEHLRKEIATPEPTIFKYYQRKKNLPLSGKIPISGYYISNYAMSGSGAAVPLKVYYLPIMIPYPTRIVELAAYVNIAADVVARLGIYSFELGKIETLIDSNIVALDSTGLRQVAVNIFLDAGLYCVAFLMGNTGSPSLGLGSVFEDSLMLGYDRNNIDPGSPGDGLPISHFFSTVDDFEDGMSSNPTVEPGFDNEVPVVLMRVQN